MNHQDGMRDALAAGDMEAAAKHASSALDADPSNIMLRARLGSIQMSLGNLEAAVENLCLAANAAPDAGVIWNEFGVALAKSGAAQAAEDALRKAILLSPEIPQIHNNYGNVLRGRGDYGGAIVSYRTALDKQPDYLEARGNLGVALQEEGDAAAAITCFEEVLASKPDYGPAWTHLGAAFAAQGRLVDAEQAHRKAIVLLPDSPDGYNNLGIVLKDQGRLDEARDAYQRALECDPNDAGVHSNLLMCLCYDPAVDAVETIAMHRDWAQRHAPERAIEPFDPDGQGPLRVGILSPDFREHSVAFFVDSIFANHEGQRIELHCYSDTSKPDATSARLRSHVPHWHDVFADDDEALYQRIRRDGIQVLVDLAGHTANNRLPVFARRAAPVQVTWLGYGMTTGMPQMDYLLTDNWVDPSGDADDWCTETLYRLPSGFMCYTPPNDCPLPVRDAAWPFTFGSFNNLSKINDDVIALWARVLKAAPGSRLLLKSRQLADPEIGARVRRQFTADGVDAERLVFAGRTSSRAEHYALYGQVDVALDTFPYNGATTTCEALWMGTPVVALAGDRHVGRFGVTFLSRAGYPEWVASSPEDYIAIAGRLVRDRPDRDAIREKLTASMLLDGVSAARDLEDAFHMMWQRYVGHGNG